MIQSAAYDLIKQEGFQEGFIEGKQTGFIEGKQTGFIEGKQTGFTSAMELSLKLLKFGKYSEQILKRISHIKDEHVLNAFENFLDQTDNINEIMKFLDSFNNTSTKA